MQGRRALIMLWAFAPLDGGHQRDQKGRWKVSLNRQPLHRNIRTFPSGSSHYPFVTVRSCTVVVPASPSLGTTLPWKLDQAEIKLRKAHLKVRLRSQGPRFNYEETEARRSVSQHLASVDAAHPPPEPGVWRTRAPRAQPHALTPVSPLLSASAQSPAAPLPRRAWPLHP